jgi:NAD(P)-dependent dehydrogenase (short-subunit alcohol dehydrogenase family)
VLEAAPRLTDFSGVPDDSGNTRHDLFDLTGRVAVVTGGSRGLGREMVLAFAEHGADVVIASRKLDACRGARPDVRALGRRALPSPITPAVGRRRPAVRRGLRRVRRMRRAGEQRRDVAAVPERRRDHRELYDKVMGVNLKGPVPAVGARRHPDGR